MVFRLADEAEKISLLNLYDHDRDSEFTAWDDSYPTMEDIERDLAHNNLFVLENDGKVIGAISINFINELDGEPEFSSSKALEFGRVIVHPDYRGQGYAKLLLQNVEKEIKHRGYNWVHISVFAGCPVALSLYRTSGYREVKDFMFDYAPIPFKLFEKELL